MEFERLTDVSISFKHTGNFSKTLQFLNILADKKYLNDLNAHGLEGVRALASATPSDTGATAAAWDYTIEDRDGKLSITWFNHNTQDGVNIAVILHYGHGTRNGGYVQGRQYIAEAIRPVFDKIADDVWKEVVGI